MSAEVYQDPELRVEAQNALAVIENSRELLVVDQASLTVASTVLGMIKDYKDEVEAELGPGIKQAYEHHKYLVGQRKKWVDRVLPIEEKLRARVGAYIREQDRLRLEEQRAAYQAERKARMEADKAADLVNDLVSEGRLDEAEQAQAEAQAKIAEIVSSVPAVREKPEAGVSARVDWDFEVVDFSKVPDKYKVINRTMVLGIVKAVKDQLDIPGIVPVTKDRVVVKGGK